MTESAKASIGISYLHVLWRAPALIAWMLLMPLLFLLLRALRLSAYKKTPHWFHKGVCFILGLKVSQSGVVHEGEATLYVSNHISYLDVFALGQIPGYFVAKSEVATWPILGQLAKFQNTLFIERKSGKAKQVLEVLQEYLHSGNSLILFPEGTSTNGTVVQPFKSSLFEAAAVHADSSPIPIQPITVAYTHQNGQKMNQAMRDHYAWYATMPFLGHFLKLQILKKVDVKVHFHPVCYREEYKSRKECAEHCQSLIAKQLDKLNA